MDLDIAHNLPSSITLEHENYVFSVDIIYEDLPRFCTKCKFLDHGTGNCRKKVSELDCVQVHCRLTFDCSSTAGTICWLSPPNSPFASSLSSSS